MTAALTINYRKPELTLECVASLLADGWNPIVVWDNSEDDGESTYVLTERLADHPSVEVICSPHNIGFGAAMNRALAHLGRRGYSGPVLLVNNDARVKSGLRVAMIAALTDPRGLTLVAPCIEQNGHEQGWLHYQPWLGLVTKRPVWGSFQYLSGCCLLVNRPHNDVPLFDETFFMYGEDVELSRRVARQGGRLILLDQALVTHLGSASSGPASEFYEYQVVLGHRLLARKLANNPVSAAAMCMFRVPITLARACVRSMRFRSIVPLKALVWVPRQASNPHTATRD